jgi:hypothetical protein
MRQLTFAVAAFGLAVMLGATPAAAQFDRTDLAEGNWYQTNFSTKATSTGTGSSFISRTQADNLYVNAGGSYGTYGYMMARNGLFGATAGVDASTNAGGALLRVILYEPEKIGRKDTSAKMQQKTQLGYRWQVGASGSVSVSNNLSGTLPDCGMKVQGKGTDTVGATNQLKLKMKCKTLLADMGMTADEQKALLRIMGLTA